MGKFQDKIKGQFFTGIIVLMPLGLTAWIVWVLFRVIGKRFLPLFENYQALADLPLAARMTISAFLTVIVIWAIGFLARNFIGKGLLHWLEKLLLKTPVVSKIYKTIRQLTDSMFVNKQAFKEVALIEYPRRGLYTVVFVTNADIEDKKGKDLTAVFIPSTPNPTTGYCILLPTEDVKKLSISVNQAMEFIFSGGILVPGDMEFPDFEKK
ncbi:MAG: DUF502 domain-containing protein [Elusimicrobia bacterium]|jgi:uncharacterized membrane protein|nr:DUF502 domain-containing protein [Elusimicrobiota bacterium]